MTIWKNEDIQSPQTLWSLKHSYCNWLKYMLFFIAFSDTLLNYYDRFLIVLDAAQWEFCEANGVFINCDFSVGPLLYSRVQFNELGKY